MGPATRNLVEPKWLFCIMRPMSGGVRSNCFLLEHTLDRQALQTELEVAAPGATSSLG